MVGSVSYSHCLHLMCLKIYAIFNLFLLSAIFIHYISLDYAIDLAISSISSCDSLRSNVALCLLHFRHPAYGIFERNPQRTILGFYWRIVI